MPKSTIDQAKKLARLSSDCSFLLTHLVRNNDIEKLTPKDKLISILNINNHKNPKLLASPTGWYGVSTDAKIFKPHTGGIFLPPENIKSVCFTDSTLTGLKAHREVFKVKYGIAFDRDFLFKNGANPCINIRESLLKSEVSNPKENSYNFVYNFIPNELAGFVNIIHESFDATHEREWRIIGDFDFRYLDIKFIFCPENEFDLFHKIQKNGLPVLFDLNWLDRI